MPKLSRAPKDFHMDGKEFFAILDSALNGLSALLLVCGYVMIRQRKMKAHAAFMVSALISSAIFLGCYLTSKYLYHDHRVKNYHDWRSILYLVVLIPHVLLAIGMLPLIGLTVYRAAKGQFIQHRRIAPYTLGIWLYVSVTGVLIYFLMYHLLKPAGLI